MSKFKVGEKVILMGQADIKQESGFGTVVIEGESSVHIRFPDGQQWDVPDHYIGLVKPKSDKKFDGDVFMPGAFKKSLESVLQSRFDKALERLEYPNPPHVHKDMIIAWANGAEIEYRSKHHANWITFVDTVWLNEFMYRIKPAKTPLQLKIDKLEAKLVKLKGRL
jgi:hypothetical protein